MNKNILKYFCLAALLALGVQTAEAATVATTADNVGYETLAAALAAVRPDNALTSVDASVWPEGKQAYYNGEFHDTLWGAIDKANKDNAETSAQIYCRPNKSSLDPNGGYSHPPITTSITIWGNNARIGKAWTPTVEYDSDDGKGGIAGDGRHFLKKNVSHAIYNLHDGAGYWGFRGTDYTMDLALVNCDNIYEIMVNNEKSGLNAVVNITLQNCTIDSKAASFYPGDYNCPISTTWRGCVRVLGCTFKDAKCVLNLNKKNGGDMTVEVKDCTFTRCGETNQSFGPIRLTGKSGTLQATIDGVTITDTVVGTGAGEDITVGSKDVASKNGCLVSYDIKNTSATISVYEKDADSKLKITKETIVGSQTYKGGNSDVVPVEHVAKIGEKGYETLAEALSAVKTGETVEIVKAGEYIVDSIGGAGYSVVATVDGVVFKRENIKQYPVEDWISGCSDTVTLSNITWKIGTGYYSHFKKVHAINCRFEGRMYCENGVVFDNCTFVKEPGDYPIYTYHGGVTFNQCTFDCGGKCINVYSEIRGTDKTPYVITVNGCTFKNSGEAKKAAILVKEYVDGSSEHYFDIILQGTQTLVGKFPSGSYESEVTFAYGDGIIAVEAESETGTGHVRIFEGDKSIYPAAAVEPEVVPEKPTQGKAEEATKVVDDKGEEVTPTAAAKAEVAKVVKSFDNPEIAKVETHVAEAAMTVTGEGDEQKVVVKSAIVEELKKVAPAGTVEQITSESDVKSYVKVALNAAKVAVAETTAALKSVTFDVKPMAETTVLVGKEKTVVAAPIPNSEIVKPITFRLPLTDAFTVSAIVTHEGDPDRLCMVQGVPGSLYAEVTASHFSYFTVTPSEIVETKTESKTVLGIKRVDYIVEQKTADLAAAVPWLMAAEANMPVSKLITTGLSELDQIQVYDKAADGYYTWLYRDGEWQGATGTPSADEYTLERGRAFWYKPVGGKGSSGTYTQVGLYSEASITSKVDSAAVASATFANPVHFLMASPKYEDFNLKEKLTADAGCAANDVVVVVATGARYRFNGTVWGQDIDKKVTKFGVTVTQKVFEPTDGAISVPAGTAFWYLSAGGAPEFEW